MTKLSELIDTLGPSVVRMASPPLGDDPSIHDVVVQDPADPLQIRSGDLVLSVGVIDHDELVALIDQLAFAEATALITKAGVLHDARIVKAAESSGLALLFVPDGASWYQILLLIQSVLSGSSLYDGGASHEIAGGLFSLADSVATLANAPVTIEDRWSCVLAYSIRQEEADDARAQTLVGRRVPERYLERLNELRVFERLRSEIGPIYVEGIGEQVLPRMVTAIWAGDEFLGSMWAAMKSVPSPPQERAFADAAKVASLHLLRQRAEADAELRSQRELVARVLEGDSGIGEAAERFGITGDGFRVLAMWVADDDQLADERGLAQLRDVLQVHVTAHRQRAAVAVLGPIAYCIMAVDGEPDVSQSRAMEFARNFIGQLQASVSACPLVGVGGHAASLAEVPRSRAEADETLRVVRDRGGDPAVGVIEEMRMGALLRRFADVAGGDKKYLRGKIGRLLDSDEKSGTNYIGSLRAYFDCFGDFSAAARRLHLHPNTMRYRLRRATELSGIDLDDPEERLSLMLVIRVLLEPRDSA